MSEENSKQASINEFRKKGCEQRQLYMRTANWRVVMTCRGREFGEREFGESLEKEKLQKESLETRRSATSQQQDGESACHLPQEVQQDSANTSDSRW